MWSPGHKTHKRTCPIALENTGGFYKTKAKPFVKDFAFMIFFKSIGCLLFVAVAIAAHELVDAAGSIDEFLFAGEEGVRRACDFKLYEGIGHTVDLDSLLSGYGRAGDESFVVGHVLKHDLAVIVGMDALFHRYVSVIL